MKRILILSGVGFALMMQISCQNVPEQGLVAYFPLNGEASDVAGKGRTVEIHEAIPVRDRFGQDNGAYYFNGSSAYILVLVDNMPDVDHPQSISWWFMIEEPPVYSDSMNADNMISLVDSAEGIGLQFGYRGPGYHTLGLDTWYWGGRTVLETHPPAENTWHHCVYTYDGQVHRFYLDGKETVQSARQPQIGTPTMLMLGNYPSGDQFYTGSLDDLRVYNRSLSPLEIGKQYNGKE